MEYLNKKDAVMQIMSNQSLINNTDELILKNSIKTYLNNSKQLHKLLNNYTVIDNLNLTQESHKLIGAISQLNNNQQFYDDKIEQYLELLNKTESLENSDKLKKKFLELLNKSKVSSEHEILPDMLTYISFPDQLQQSFLKGEMFKIHLIPHTHLDMGWLKTINNYYFGGEILQWPSRGGVQYIINSVISVLVLDSSKKFSFSEIGYFSKWYYKQTSEIKLKVKQLVKNKQIEFLNGGWCQNDEATTYYEDIIDQMQLGHTFLRDEFDYIPQIGWQIDTFGHSSSQALLSQLMGFNGLFFARIDYLEKQQRMKQKNLEFLWNNEDGKSSIFSSILYNHYNGPKDFRFDELELREPIIDDPDDENYNLDIKSKQFVNYFRHQSMYYQTPNEIMHVIGNDFAFENANMNFMNFDKLIKYINENQKMFNTKIFYSSVNDYVKSIYSRRMKQMDMISKYKEYNGDFFPYIDKYDSYWSGFYTSKSCIKLYIRESGRFLQKVRNLGVLLRINGQFQYFVNKFLDVQSLQKSVAVSQHHDAITGTEKQKVAYDYLKQISKGENQIDQFMNHFLNELNEKTIDERNLTYIRCNLNDTQGTCNIDRLKNHTLVSIYNPSYQKNQIIQLKTSNKSQSVFNVDNQLIKSYVICANTTDSNDCDLYFEAEMNQNSFNYFKVNFNEKENNYNECKQNLFDQIIQLGENSFVKVYSNFSFEITKCVKDECISQYLQIDYQYYKASQSNISQNSGAYIFKPASKRLEYSFFSQFRIFQSELVSVLSFYGTQVSTQIKFFTKNNQEDIVEVHTFLNPVTLSDNQGKEIMMVIKTLMDNKDRFYTDSNGLQMIERNYKNENPVEGNFYPVTSICSINDQNKQLHVIFDRSQGVSSRNGEIEILIQRRLMSDDGRGVNEILNEIEQQEGIRINMKHLILFSQKQSSPRDIQYQLDLRPIIYISQTNKSIFTKNDQNFTWVQLNIPMFQTQANLKYYLYHKENDEMIIRFQNQNEYEDMEVIISQDYQFFEVTLTANQLKKTMQQNKLIWKFRSDYLQQLDPIQLKHKLLLKPLQIRTFLVNQVK